jgi:uncharacterized protein (TIRG00374 family)
MNWRRFISVGLIGLFAAIFIPHWMQITDLIGVLRQGRLAWLAAGLAIQLLWFINQTALYQSIYRLLKMPAQVNRLLPIVLASNFVNFATPTASLGALPLFLDDARQHGLDEGSVTLTNVLRVCLNLAWFSIPLSFSLAVLFFGHMLRPYHLIAAAILLASTVLMMAGLVLAGLRPDGFARLLERMASCVSHSGQHVLKRDLIDKGRANYFAHQFSAAAVALWAGRRHLVRPWIHTMLLDALELAVLLVMFRAFPAVGPSLSFTQLAAGYTLGVLFSVVAITPQGLGVVEGTLVAVFTHLGLPMERAAVVMLAYRGLSFWLPLLAGFVALRWVRGLGKPTANVEHAASG